MSYDDHIYGEPPENFERETSGHDLISDDCKSGKHLDCDGAVRYRGQGYDCECDCGHTYKLDALFGESNIWR